MNRFPAPLAASISIVVGSACLLLCGACGSGTPSGRGGYRSSRAVEVHPGMAFEDDYDYYPSYEVYYSRNLHEYVYFDRNRWVRSSEPSIVSLNVLLASPAVRMDFRDSPERHHAAVVRSYPRDWHEQNNRPEEHRKDHRDKKDGKENGRDDSRDDHR